MKIFLSFFFISIFLIFNAGFAKGGMGGMGNFGPVSGGAMPPGLQGKGLPHGLSKQNKIPHGWSQGRKTGWTRVHHHNVQGTHPNDVVNPIGD